MNPILQPVDEEITRLNNQNGTYVETIAQLRSELAAKDDWSLLSRVHARTDLNTQSIWTQPGNTGDTGGGSQLLHGTSAFAVGNPARIKVRPMVRAPGQPWDEFYFFADLGAFPGATKFNQTIEFSYPSAADLAACYALELDWEHNIGGFAYQAGWQLLWGKGDGGPVWRYFNFVEGAWHPFTQIPLTADMFPVYIESRFEEDRDKKTMRYVDISVNGKIYSVNVLNPGKSRYDSSANYTHYGFQLDTDGRGAAYSVNAGKMNALFL